MDKKKLFKRMTFILSIAVLMVFTYFGASVIGNLTHEFYHLEFAVNPVELVTNNDGSGYVAAEGFVSHSHEYTYLRAQVVEVLLMVIAAFCVLVVGSYGQK